MKPLLETTAEGLQRAPWGRYAAVGPSIVWCASNMLAGACMWGCAGPDETRAAIRVLDAYERVMAPSFTLILDARAVDGVNPDSLQLITTWMWDHRAALLERIRIWSLIRPDPAGFLLAGLLPAIANNQALQVDTDAEAVFERLLGPDGRAMAAQLDDVANRLRGVPRELLLVRELLAARLDATIEDAARTLHASPRSVQRVLAKHGTSFHAEQLTARFQAARELLRTTDLKVAAIAARIGISERALAQLFRSKLKTTPTAWRARERSRASGVELLVEGR
jgi:AraC-like DNA-binding protein